MWRRRAVALLCVLLGHAVLVWALLNFLDAYDRVNLETSGGFTSLPITIDLDEEPEPQPPPVITAEASRPAPAPPAATESTAIAAPAAASPEPPRGPVDWPLEGRKSVERVLAAEREAERIAKLFSGPGGTWASLTKRERSRLRKFRWKPGVDGLERDATGNTIYHISEGCVVVNFLFIGCALGKEKVHGDLFKDMRLYFDEQRMPPLDTGNGTER